jgi:tetratricopeptide (TPR) repeat protein
LTPRAVRQTAFQRSYEQPPEGLYEQAMRFQREGRLEDALAAYSKVIMGDGEFAEAFYGRATVYYSLGNCDQAINDCNRSIELRRLFVEAHLMRGAAYWGKAVQCDPQDAQIGAYCQQVVSDCTFVLDYQSRNALAYFNRGLAYWALGNKPMAKHDLENAVALSHNLAWRAEAESWLEELKKPAMLSRYEPDSWHHICGSKSRE